MQIAKADRKRYPKFSAYVLEEMPKLARDARVVDEMNALTGLGKRQIRRALGRDAGPTVTIVADLVCNGRAAGCFRDIAPGYIEIDEAEVERFEAGEVAESYSTGVNDVVKTGVILLHELVHWADYRVDGKHTLVLDPYHDVGSKYVWLVFATFLPEMEGG